MRRMTAKSMLQVRISDRSFATHTSTPIKSNRFHLSGTATSGSREGGMTFRDANPAGILLISVRRAGYSRDEGHDPLHQYSRPCSYIRDLTERTISNLSSDLIVQSEQSLPLSMSQTRWRCYQSSHTVCMPCHAPPPESWMQSVGTPKAPKLNLLFR